MAWRAYPAKLTVALLFAPAKAPPDDDTFKQMIA